MPKLRVGVQLAPQHTTIAAYLEAACEVEALGVDTVWTWDHFMPPWFDEPPTELSLDPLEGNHYEAWTLLSAMAMVTQRAEVGCLVTCNSYRNPALLSAMAKTVDHLSNGRLILGLGAGWFEHEYREYGFRFGTAKERLQELENSIQTIRERWMKDKPLPVRQPVPILIGGEGEQVTLRLAAQFADIWNSGASPDNFRHKCSVLDQWCEIVGREPGAIERSVNLYGKPETELYDAYSEAGARHLILNVGAPWDLKPVEQLVEWKQRKG